MSSTPPIDDERLHKAAKIAAEIVTKFGDDYWPVFDRIDRELETRLNRQSRLAKFNDQDGYGIIQDG